MLLAFLLLGYELLVALASLGYARLTRVTRL